MNIIEAIQAAESGALITNNFLNAIGHFLKYMGSGVFYEYELLNGSPQYKYEVRHFSTAYVLSNAWEVLENNPFDKKV